MLVLVAGEPGIGLPALSRKLGMPKSTTFRILSALKSSGFVMEAEGGHRFRLGPLIDDLTHGSARRERLIRVLHPLMEQLRDECNETVALHVLEGSRRVVIDQVESRQELRRTFTNLGTPMALGATAAGKLFLAYMPDAEQAAYLRSHELPRYTPNTLSREELANDLSQILRRGYATSFEEVATGVAGIAMAVPSVGGEIHAAIGISGPVARFGSKAILRMRPQLRKTVDSAAALLSGSPSNP